MKVDYVHFTIPNEFVKGYGLDYAEKYRNLPDIGVLDPKIYSEEVICFLNSALFKNSLQLKGLIICTLLA